MIHNIKTFLMVLFLFLIPSLSANSQPQVDTTTIARTEESSTRDSSSNNVETLKAEHAAEIKRIVNTTTTGKVIWSYFGEIILGIFSIAVVGLRALLLNFSKQLIEKVKDISFSSSVASRHTNQELLAIGILNSSIDSYLTDIKEITKSKRVLLYQFSNGNHFFSNIPVLRTTVTNNSMGDIPTATSNHFNYVTAKEIIHEILNNEYVQCTEIPTDKYNGYTSYLRFANFKNATLIRLSVGDNYCGIIELIEPEDFNSITVKAYCLSIGHLFERFNSKEAENKELSLQV